MKRQLIGGILLLLSSTLALAHPGHALSSAYAGFMHPLTGWDHLLVMLAIGFWAAKLTGNMRWQLPLSFVAFMAVGASLGFLGLNVSSLEIAIAASVFAMGVLLMLNLAIPKKISIAIVAIFALCHGLAHGLELNGVELDGSESNGALMGMLLATALLHGAGYLIGLQQHQIRYWLTTGLAFSMMILGGALLVQ